MSALKRFPLAQLPTPLHKLERLTAELGGPQLYIKRDDLTGLGGGGNKVRKLEYLLADALEQGAETLVTCGAIQSNHARQTAAAAARAGLRCVLVLAGLGPVCALGNTMLDGLFGAHIRWTGSRSMSSLLEDIVREERAVGRVPYVIPYGGSSPIGAAGYVGAMREISKQADEQGIHIDRVVFATSSGGTQAGLLVGAWMTEFEGRIFGISVDKSEAELKKTVLALSPLVASVAGYCGPSNLEKFEVCDHYLGLGYTRSGRLEWDAIRLLARTEGLLVDPVYTGRALGGLVDLIDKGEIVSDESVLFLHTGGTPALYSCSAEDGAMSDDGS